MTYDSTFAALADPTRRAVFETLVHRPSAVGVLAEAMPVSRPAVSQHLKVLTDAGLVTMRRQGRSNVYAVRREGLAEVRAYLDRLWGDVLSDFSNEIDRRGDFK